MQLEDMMALTFWVLVFVFFATFFGSAFLHAGWIVGEALGVVVRAFLFGPVP